MSESPIPIVRVTVTELRERFNRGRYWEKTQTGELKAVVERERCPALTLANEPYGTRSQQVSYYDNDGNEVARVHQYTRLDGTIGASGKPDPKRIFENGIMYRIQTKSSQELELAVPNEIVKDGA